MIGICVDKRTELLGLMLRLSNYKDVVPNMFDNNFYPEYERLTIEYLKPYINHKIINELNSIIKEFGVDFAYGRPIELFMQMDESYNFLGVNSEPFKTRLKGSDRILKFLNSVKDFVKDIDFELFYMQNEDFYMQCVKDYEKLVRQNEKALFDFLSDFYMTNIDPNGYCINLLLHQCSGSNGIKTGEKVYCHEGAYRKISLNPSAGEIVGYLAHLIHEFSHPIINPLTEKYRYQFGDKIKNVLCNISMEAGYSGVNTYINETLVRSIQTYFAEKMFGKTLKNSYTNHSKQGFNQVEFIVSKLHKMESKQYKNFEEKYIELLNALIPDLMIND
ncbi:MAG: DUF4932 domain-containing protein [Clostridia bacterium]|nr:DUF4932 domain-containing protein [Clostridia bacterium]